MFLLPRLRSIARFCGARRRRSILCYVVSHVEPDGTYVGLIPHDLRRSYVRSIDSSGVPSSLSQKITGHLDAAVYEQYNKKHQSDLRSAAQKRAEYLSQAV